MDFEYVPVLRNLKGEREVLLKQKTSTKIMPLIELLLEKPSSKSKLNFTSFNEQLFNNMSNPFLVDIPMYINLSKKTKPNVAQFLYPIYNNQIYRCYYLNSLSNICHEKLIPVVSYNPNDNYSKDLIVKQNNLLRNNYKKLAFRIFDKYNEKIMDELKIVLQPGDIILLDILNKRHNDPSLFNLYSRIYEAKKIFNCTTVIIHKALSNKIVNSKLVDNQIIPDTITDLKILYNSSKYMFDAFGDFSGIKASNLESIPATSPAYIHYCSSSNNYIGFKGIYKKVTTFETMILPNYTSSIYWTNITNEHKNLCYGCTLIQNMLLGNLKINYPSRWKTLTISHYIQSMNEIL